MGVEHRLYLVAEDPTFRPSAAAICRLVNALQAGEFVAASSPDDPRRTFNSTSPEYEAAMADGCLLQTGPDVFSKFRVPCSVEEMRDVWDADFRLVWDVADFSETNLKYPMTLLPETWAYYTIEIHSAIDYIHASSECVDPIAPAIRCECGQILDYFNPDDEKIYVFDEFRIYGSCPACTRPARPQDYSIRPRCGRSGQELDPKIGGCAYLFAVYIDFGKCHHVDGDFEVSDEFRSTCEIAVGSKLRPIGHWV